MRYCLKQCKTQINQSINYYCIIIYRVEEYNMKSLLYAGLITGGILLLFYYLWSWCSDRETKQDDKSNNKGKLSMKPVYAHEIEHGIVVLQRGVFQNFTRI